MLAFAMLPWIAALNTTVRTHGAGKGDDPWSVRGQTVLRAEAANAWVKRTSLARYRHLKYLEAWYGTSLADQTFEARGISAIFPARRADRLYLLIFNASEFITRHAPGADMLLCYQWKNGKARLLYKVKVKWFDEQNKAQPTISHTLRQVLHHEGIVVQGRVGAYTARDLDGRGDYIGYDFNAFCSLFVTAFSRPDMGDYGPVMRDGYSPPCEPDAVKGLEAFRRKNGLPVSSTEFPPSNALKK